MSRPTGPCASDDELRATLDAALDGGESDPLTALLHVLAGASRSSDVTRAPGPFESFELRRLAGIGGMGTTYEALDRDGDRVAVKIVEALSPDQQDRFEAECRILRGLEHPNIVRYRAHGMRTDGTGYLVMDFVEGTDLQTMLEAISSRDGDDEAAVTLLAGIDGDALASAAYQRRITRMLATVAEAVDHAHAAGILHRDLKPANILLRSDLEPVLIDFGLGRDLFRNVSLTRSGAVMGTLSYMAPEQLRPPYGFVDVRTDVFSLGLVLYRCLTGTELRRDLSDVFRFGREALLLRRNAVGHLARSMQAILYRSLEPRPSRRYQNMADFAEDLRAALGSGTVRARVPGPIERWRRTKQARFGIPAALVLVLLSLILLLRRPAHLLFAVATDDRANLTIDGDGPLRVPLSGWQVDAGRRVIECFHDAIHPCRTVIDIDRKYNFVCLLTVPAKQTFQDRLFEGPSAAFLTTEAGSSEDRVLVDGKLLVSPAGWARLAPGRHTIRGENASGHDEEQTLVLQAGVRSPVSLVSETLRDVPGKYRFTLGSVLSPRPANVSLELQDGAVAYMNAQDDPSWQRPGERSVHTHVTSLVEGREVRAVLAIRFPFKAKSAAFHFNLGWRRATDTVRVEYRAGEGAFRKISKPRERKDPVQAEMPPEGAETLELVGYIRTRQKPDGYATAWFLGSYLARDKPHVGRDPCFGIVADPDPNRARLP